MKIERPPEPQIPARLPLATIALSSPQAIAARLRWLRQLAALLSWRIYPENATRIDTSASCFADPALELLAHGHIIDDTAIITFRGTIGPFYVSTNWKKVNLRIKQIGNPPRHEGFHEGWMALRPTIVSWLEGTTSKALVLTGAFSRRGPGATGGARFSRRVCYRARNLVCAPHGRHPHF